MTEPSSPPEAELADPVRLSHDPTGAGRSRFGVACGVVLFAYTVWWSGSLALATASRATFNATHRGYAGVAGRLVIAVVMVAGIFHTVVGLAGLLDSDSDSDSGADADPAAGARGAVPRRIAGWLRAGAPFLTGALGLPAALIVLWPAIRGWFA